MIIKVKTFKKPQFEKLLNYMMEDRDRLFDKQGRSFVVTHNLRGEGIENWTKQFFENEKFRKKRKNGVFLSHEILSWHKKDAEKINLEKLEEITREYIRQKNPKGMYVACPHYDKDHYHVHVCASSIEYRSGKSLRMSKTEFASLKKDIQQYQKEKFPEISNSYVRHGEPVSNSLSQNMFISDGEYHVRKRGNRETDKEKIAAIIKKHLPWVSSPAEFNKRLEKENLKVYLRRGVPTGVWFGKRKFRFKRLGIDLEKFDITLKRTNELEKFRNQNRTKYKSREF